MSQEGRAALQLLGNLQEYSSRDLRKAAQKIFYTNDEMAAVGDAPMGQRPPEELDRLAKKATSVAETIQAHRIERFLQRMVAEGVYDRGIPAAEVLRPQTQNAPEPDMSKAGTLTLNPDLETPAGFNGVEWHLMPGGWDGYDLSGTMFMAGVSPYIFARGGYAAVPVNADIMRHRQDFLDQLPKDIDYKRVYDFGCAGSGLLSMVRGRYPEAELTGSDLSANLLRGGHRMDAMLGLNVALKQESASNTSEPDNHYDAALSYAVFHEMDDGIARAALEEMFRILAPGGVLLISDPGPLQALSPYQAALYDWDTEHREEPFFSDSIRRPLLDWMREIGFVDCEAYAIGEDSYPWITKGRKPA